MPSKERVIMHIDCDAFFASVEELFHPEYKDVPMAVCGNPKHRRGIILAKNQLAKGFGIKTAETVYSALQKCPGLTLAPPRRKEYDKYCGIVNSIYDQYTDLIEVAGIDESYLDVTGTLHPFRGDPVRMANAIREHVNRETGLTVSVGISFNKIFAKLTSDLKKPNAVSYISRENYKSIVWPMPVRALLLVGQKTAEDLNRVYITTVGELANADEHMLKGLLGKIGEQLHIYANGLDESPVVQESDPSSVGHGLTFTRNLTSREDIKTSVAHLSDGVARRLRRMDVKCMSVQVTIKDANLKVITRQKGLTTPTWLASDLTKESLTLIEASWKIGVPIRLLAVTAQKLIPADEAMEQVSLFSSQADTRGRERREQLERAMDKVRDKYGTDSILSGAVINNDLGIGDDDYEPES